MTRECEDDGVRKLKVSTLRGGKEMTEKEIAKKKKERPYIPFSPVHCVSYIDKCRQRRNRFEKNTLIVYDDQSLQL